MPKIRCLIRKIIRLIILIIPLIVTRKMGILFSASEKLCAQTILRSLIKYIYKKHPLSTFIWGKLKIKN